MKARMCAAALAACLAACGGGGGNPGSTAGAGSTGGSGGTSTGTGTGTGTTAVAKTTLVAVDGKGNPSTTFAGGETATIKATVTLASGKPAAGALVTFTAGTDKMVVFDPVSGSATTDASGVATIKVRSASTSSAGALAINVTAADLEKQTSTATMYLSFGAAPLTVGKLAFVPVPSAPLPAFNTLSLNIPLTNGADPATTAPGLSMTSLCVGDGTATLVAGPLANGVQLATYTNNGCTRGTDVITVSAGSSSQTISVPVVAANIGSIQFVGSNLSGASIVLKGSGGQGRSESAQLTFRVVDSHNTGLPGVDVDFAATTNTGGLSVTPLRVTTDANGNVSTMVSSGTIPTPVRVTATATRNNVTVSGLSDALTVSTGLPIQKSMSMSVDKYNIEGGEVDGVTANITVRLADQYGNPVSNGTAINFVTEGGAVGSAAQGACTTIDGACTVPLVSQNFRPVNGRVTVLAYAQGIEDFIDANGDGQYSCTNYVDPVTGKVPTTYRPLVDTCLSGGESFTDLGDPFLDTGYLGSLAGMAAGSTLDGKYESAKGDLPFPYNHASYAENGDGKWGLNYIRSSVEIAFSNSTAIFTRQVCANGICRDWTVSDGDASKIAGVAGAGCSAQPLYFRLTDSNNNPLPSGTSISSTDASKLSVGTIAPATVPSTNVIGGTIHSAIVKPDSNCAAGSFTLQINTPRGKATPFMFSSQ
ncbi:MAG: hypothetical protein ACXU9C_20395 [Xanthobacteraceae bacterium]